MCIEFHCCPTVVRVFGVSMRTSCTESEVGVKRICFYKLKLARSLCSCGWCCKNSDMFVLIFGIWTHNFSVVLQSDLHTWWTQHFSCIQTRSSSPLLRTSSFLSFRLLEVFLNCFFVCQWHGFLYRVFHYLWLHGHYFIVKGQMWDYGCCPCCC